MGDVRFGLCLCICVAKIVLYSMLLDGFWFQIVKQFAFGFFFLLKQFSFGSWMLKIVNLLLYFVFLNETIRYYHSFSHSMWFIGIQKLIEN